MAAKPTRNALGSHGVDSGRRLRVVRVPWAVRVNGRHGVEAVGSGQLAKEGPGGDDDRTSGLKEVYRIEGQVDDHLNGVGCLDLGLEMGQRRVKRVSRRTNGSGNPRCMDRKMVQTVLRWARKWSCGCV